MESLRSADGGRSHGIDRVVHPAMTAMGLRGSSGTLWALSPLHLIYRLLIKGGGMEIEAGQVAGGADSAREEGNWIPRLQSAMTMVMQCIAQDGSLSIDEASQMIADSKKAALAMFPDKELAYEIIWRPRFQRLMRERFRIM